MALKTTQTSSNTSQVEIASLTLELKDDGNLVLYDGQHKSIWSTENVETSSFGEGTRSLGYSEDYSGDVSDHSQDSF